MAAYASLTHAQGDLVRPRNHVHRESISNGSSFASSERVLGQTDLSFESAFVVELVNRLAERVAAAVAVRLGGDAAQRPDEWLDSRQAAGYLGVHRDTLRRLAAERAIPSEQDGPRCKLYFRRSVLDDWRHGGGRSCHLAANLVDAA